MKNLLLIFALLAINTQLLQAQVGIGTTTPNSTLTVDGSFSATATILSADTTLDETHYMVWSNGHVVTLPDGALCPGRIYIIKSGTSATVTPAGGNTIDGSTNSITLASDEFIIVQSLLGGAWVITTTTGAKEINDLSDGKTSGAPGQSLYLGEFAGAVAASSVPRNTGIGVAALGGNTANGNNTAIGYGAGGNITTGEKNIMIGSEAHSSAATASNELNIGKAIYGTNIYNVGAARIGINQQTPNASAALDITSTTTGLLIPRMTQVQRDAITTPATGLMIYQTDATSGFYYYDGSAWVSITGAKEISDLSDGLATNSNVFLGFNAGGSSTGAFNVATGLDALQANTTGIENAAYGYFSLNANVSGDNNSAFGNSSLVNATGSDNIAFGSFAGTTTTTGNNNILLGKSVNASSATTSNELNIGNLIYAQELGSSSNNRVGINTQVIDDSAVLEIASTTKGMLIPRMLEAEKNVITTPATGLMIFQTDGAAGFYYYTGAAWTPIGSVSSDTKSIITVSAITYTALLTDYTIIFNTSGASTLTLPTAASASGVIYVIRNRNSSDTSRKVTIQPNGSELIEGASNIVLGNTGFPFFPNVSHSYTIQSDGTEWWIISATLD